MCGFLVRCDLEKLRENKSYFSVPELATKKCFFFFYREISSVGLYRTRGSPLYVHLL